MPNARRFLTQASYGREAVNVAPSHIYPTTKANLLSAFVDLVKEGTKHCALNAE